MVIYVRGFTLGNCDSAHTGAACRHVPANRCFKRGFDTAARALLSSADDAIVGS